MLDSLLCSFTSISFLTNKYLYPCGHSLFGHIGTLSSVIDFWSEKNHKDSRKSSDELSYQVWFQLAQAQASGFKEDQNVKAYG